MDPRRPLGLSSMPGWERWPRSAWCLQVTAGEWVLVHLSETSQSDSGHCLQIRGACGQACLLPQRPWACPSISQPQVPQLRREGAHRKYLAHKWKCSVGETYFGMFMNFTQ